MTHPATVDAYLLAAPAPAQERLALLRRVIRDAAPHAVERLSYGMPTWAMPGRSGKIRRIHNLIHIAGYAHHIGVYPGTEALLAFADRLAGFPTSKGTVQLLHDAPLPLDLVRDLVLHRVRAVEQQEAATRR